MTLGGGDAGTSNVLAWQFVDAPTAAARTSIKGIQFVKHVDKSSPMLFKACVNGKHFPKVVIHLRAAGPDGGPQTIVLTNATVDSYGTDADKGKGGTGSVTESVSLNFSSVDVEYR
jgi:type VI secretion system secreted protein Hcp